MNPCVRHVTKTERIFYLNFSDNDDGVSRDDIYAWLKERTSADVLSGDGVRYAIFWQERPPNRALLLIEPDKYAVEFKLRWI